MNPLAMLKGKKTKIVAVLMGILELAKAMGYVDQPTADAINKIGFGLVIYALSRTED